MTRLFDPHEAKPAVVSTERVLSLVGALANELHPRIPLPPLTPDTDLERELGFDSLARVELVSRLESAFGVNLPETAFIEIETPRDFVRVLERVVPTLAPVSIAPAPTALEQVESVPRSVQTLDEVLAWHVQRHGERPHVYLLDEAGRDPVTYGGLLQGAERIAAGLRVQGFLPGQAAAIMLPTSRDYLFSFFAILFAGGVPVPIYPPARMSQIEDHLRRHARILDNARATILITIDAAVPLARLLRAQAPSLGTVLSVSTLESAESQGARARANRNDLALLQYTSGSTGNPKGVILSHANLLANIRAMGDALRANSGDVFVSWLPLYHDMGLIGAWLGSLYFGLPLFLMSPTSFLARPARWLQALSQYRATLSAAPNFAYELCMHKVDDADISDLDLSRVRRMFNGAEQVLPETLRRFQARFGKHGLRPDAIAPVYGLAECAVGLTFPPLGQPPLIDRVARDTFTRHGRAVAGGAHERALEFVSCGIPLPGHHVRVADETGHEAGEREEGHIEFRGPSATSGYYRNADQTRRLFRGGWLDSGDRGYIAQGQLYVTGREKDVVIRAGRNIYPHEIEQAIGDVPGIRKGCVAVFGVSGAQSGTERMVVIAESYARDEPDIMQLRAQVNAKVSDIIGEPPDDVMVVPPRSVLKTSSGKIRRGATRDLYEQGRLGRGPAPTWRQFMHLLVLGMAPEMRRIGRSVMALLYAAYVWVVFLILTPLVWAIVAVTPRPAWARAIVHRAARLMVILSGTGLRVQGAENVPTRPCVLASNHASYIDGLVITAALTGHYRFVVKREFAAQFVAGIFLRRLDALFVERVETAQGIADARAVAEAARTARLVFFPEGTFARAPGLRPFHLGAFFAAAQAGVAVVPTIIRGTRGIFRADQWFPRRGRISLVFGEPVMPASEDWPAVIGLRDEVRGEILHQLGEPDLGSMPLEQ